MINGTSKFLVWCMVPPSSFADRRNTVQLVANLTNTYGNLGMSCGGANTLGGSHPKLV